MSNSIPTPGARQSSPPGESAPKPTYKKPRPDFPLGIHKGTGTWCKRVRGKVRYFGRCKDDPKGVAALALWLEQKDALLAGREPRDKTDELVVGDLCNQFLADKEASRDNGELSPRTFATYYDTCDAICKAFGRNRLVSDLVPDDFRKLRATLASRRGLVALRNAMQRVRSVFKFAFDDGLILAPVRFGQGFKKPTMERIDAEREAQRAKHGAQMFEAHEIRLMLAALKGGTLTFPAKDDNSEPETLKLRPNLALRAMVLLAANCAFGQTDLANLTLVAVDLKTGWVTYGRSKTGVGRRIPLWEETIEAIREWLPHRPKARSKDDAGLLFLTCRGARFLRLNAKGHPIDGIGQEFNKLLEKLRLKRQRLGIYALRHGFETVAGETGDQVAVNAIMGHKDRSMASHYRERIGDDRLRRVVSHVREWVVAESEGDPPGDVDGNTSSGICVFSAFAYLPHETPSETDTQNTHDTQNLRTVPPREPANGFRIVG